MYQVAKAPGHRKQLGRVSSSYLHVDSDLSTQRLDRNMSSGLSAGREKHGAA